MGRDGRGNEALDCRTGKLFRAGTHLIILPVVAALESMKIESSIRFLRCQEMTIIKDEEKRRAPSSLIKSKAAAARKNALYFYLMDRLVTEVSTKGARHILRWQDITAAQLEEAQPARLLQVDQAGSVLGMAPDAMTYSPYGNLETGNSETLLAFNGQRLDPTTLSYALGNGYRTFSPNSCRFSNPDTLSPFGIGGLNAYAYCAGDPINRNDPSGHMPKAIKQLLGLKSSKAPKPITKQSNLPMDAAPPKYNDHLAEFGWETPPRNTHNYRNRGKKR